MDRVGFEPTTSARFLRAALSLLSKAAIERELITAQIPPAPFFFFLRVKLPMQFFSEDLAITKNHLQYAM
jgi:hypothetical protein